MAIAPEVAARKALAAHLQVQLSLSVDACQPDWFPATQSLPRPVAVSIHEAGPVEYGSDSGAPELVSMTPGVGATATALYRLGDLRVPIAVAVWCSTQAKRDELIELIDNALNQPPSAGSEHVANALAGLTLRCGAEYFSAPVTFDCDSRLAMGAPEGTLREEWRAVFQVTARIEHLRQVSVTRQTAIVAELAADPAGTGDTETIPIFTGG